MSAKSVADKLRIKPDSTVWASSAPLLELVGPMPAGVLPAGGPGEATTVILFAESAAGLRQTLAEHADQLRTASNFWVAYPKGNRADINRDSVWPIVAEYGMRPIGQAAIDETWSGMRFRLLMEGEAPFTGGR
jgi:hypothetical protein